MDEIAQGKGKARVWHSNRPAKKADSPAMPGKKPAAKKKAIRSKRKTAALTVATQVRHSRKDVSLPGFIEPCLATLSEKAPNSDNWIHEIKFDGYRLQAHIDNGDVKLLTRKGLDWIDKFGATAAALAKLPVDNALIDGELVVEAPDGVSSFSLLQQTLKAGDDERMIFYVFDLMYLDDEDLRSRPLEERKT